MKLKVLSAGMLFFIGAEAFAQVKKDTATKVKDIDEVVITGSYGIRIKPEQASGAAATVKGRALEAPAAASLDNALQGQVSGLMSTSNSGQPGSNTITLIRGLSSLTKNSTPLFIVDGVPIPTGDISGVLATQNALSLINPSDIEDVQVLKDGVATSIYGSRGANGVILITTKSGKAGKSNLNFVSEIGVGKIAYEKYDMMNAEESIKYAGRALWNNPTMVTNYGLTSIADAEDLAKTALLDWDGKTNTDWYNLITRSSPVYNRYNLSYSGGVKNFKVYSSLGYLQQQGLSRDAILDRYSGALKGEWQANEKLVMNFNVNLSRTVQAGPSQASSFSNPVFTGRILSPTQNPWNADGTYNLKLVYLNPQFNPLAVTDADQNKGTFNKILTSLGADYKIFPFLRFNTNFGVDYTTGDEYTFWNPDFGNGNLEGDPNGKGYLYKSLRNYFTWNWYNFLHFNKMLADKHDVGVSIGMEATQRKNEYNSLAKQGFPAGTRLPFGDVGTNPVTANSRFERWGLIGYVARASYTYDKFLTVTGSFRRDGYSGYTDYWGSFFGVGGNIELARFDFIKPVFNTLKVRASYGENGNQAVGPYDKYAQYSYSGTYLSSNAGYLFSAGAPSEGIYWETAKKSNIGLDFGIGQNNSVYGSIDFYKNKNSRQVFQVPNPGSTGFTSLIKNQADSYSQGIETTLGVKLGKNEGLNWDGRINFAYNDTKVSYINGDVNPTVINGNKAFFPGHNPTEWYLRLWAGVDPKNGDPLWYTDETKTATTNNSNAAKITFTGKQALPKYIASFNNDFNYKNFKFAFMVNYQGGYSVFDRWGFLYDEEGGRPTLNHFKASLYDSWTPENPNATRPKIVYGGNKNSSAASTRYLYDADHIRLRSVELGYRFTKELLNVNGLNGIYVYARGTNLLTYTFDKKLYFDPESNSNAFDFTASNLGIYDQTQPNMKQFIFGFSIDF